MGNDVMLGSLYLLMAIMIVAGALISRREPAAKLLKMGVAWVVIFAAGFVLFTFRDDLGYLVAARVDPRCHVERPAHGVGEADQVEARSHQVVHVHEALTLIDHVASSLPAKIELGLNEARQPMLVAFRTVVSFEKELPWARNRTQRWYGTLLAAGNVISK